MSKRRRGCEIDALERRRLLAAVFTVVSTGDVGSGTLRGAIDSANALGLPNSATIIFDLPGSGVRTIKPLSALPAIIAQVDIEGTTDANGNPLIVLDGEDAGPAVSGLVFNRNTPGNSKPSLVTGLVVNRFGGDGIDISGTAPTNVYGCRIGTDATGKKARGNGGFGLNASASNNRIGLPGDGPEFQLLVSSNALGGIGLANNNIVQNCFVGTDVTGKKALGNTNIGIEIGSSNQIGGRHAGEANLISGNTGNLASGLKIDGHDNDVLGNLIGTDVTGTSAVPNFFGMFLSGATGNSIGVAGDDRSRNIISGNQHAGLLVENGSDSNVIAGNLIGTDISRVHVLPNEDGIAIFDSSHNTVSENIINGNTGDGIKVEKTTGVCTDNLISECIIGASDISQGHAFGSGDDGIFIFNAIDTNISGTDIFASTHAALSIEGATASGNSFRNGIIFDNKQLGINVGDNTGAEHANRAANAVLTGLPDGGVNHPVLTSAVVEGNSTTIKGTFVGIPDTDYIIEFYSSESADPSGFGEGQVPRSVVSPLDVHTDGNGDATLTFQTSVRLSSGDVATAVALHDTGLGLDMSEFSNAVHVQGASVSGSVFNDVNGNKKKDSGEKTLSKQVVFIDGNNNHVLDSQELSAKSNSKGNYKLFGVPTGTVHIRLQPGSGFVQTSPSSAKPFYKPTITPLQQISGDDFGEKKSSHAPALVRLVAMPGILPMISSSSTHKSSILDDLLATPNPM